MIVDCAHYRDGRRQHEGKMSPEHAAQICKQDPGFVWLGMVEPSVEELSRVAPDAVLASNTSSIPITAIARVSIDGSWAVAEGTTVEALRSRGDDRPARTGRPLRLSAAGHRAAP